MKYLISLVLTFAMCSSNVSQYQFPEKLGYVLPQELVHDTSSSKVENQVVTPFSFFGNSNGNSGSQIPFVSFIMHQAEVKIFPNKHYRDEQQIEKISGIVGVTHFFLDFDLTSGFVHPYTLNYFNKLNADDFVMRFSANQKDKTTGSIEYIRKSNVTTQDKLGVNIAYFRQWKLSEIDWKTSDGKILIKVKNASFSYEGFCPQSKNLKDASLISQRPILVKADRYGYADAETMNSLNAKYGGTAVLIWENKQDGKNYFMDVHASWKDIFMQAKSISEKFGVDPTIAIGDAGPYSAKVYANKSNCIDVSDIDNLCMGDNWFGAGFGYTPQPFKIYKTEKNGIESLFFVKEDSHK
jgi:hypothetical protein